MPIPVRPGSIRPLVLAAMLLAAACAGGPGGTWTALSVDRDTRAMYASRADGDFVIPAIPNQYLADPRNRRQIVPYVTDEPPGTIVVDPWDLFLYFVLEDDRAIRYRVGVGELGRQFAGRANVAFKREWPGWTPTPRMLREEPDLYEPWASGMEGGLENPLGARALYLYRNGRDTLYRIHGTYAPWSVGRAVSAGCIRLYNHDAIDLYERVDPGARVVVLTEDQAGMGTTPDVGT